MQYEKEARVMPYTTKVIREIISKKLKNGELSEDYKNYLDTPTLKKQPKMIKVPTYQGLDKLLEVLSMSYREFLVAVNCFPQYDVGWANDIQARMAAALDGMDEQQKDQIRNIISALMPEQISEALAESADKNLGWRLTDILEKGFNDDNFALKMYTELGAPDKWRQHTKKAYEFIGCPHEFIPAIAAKTGISPHWILKCGKPVLAKTESTETVMDLFCFLPMNYQFTIEQALTTAIKAGGIIIDNG